MAYRHPYQEPDDTEAMMNIQTPAVSTDPQLDQLAGQFEHWRQNRSHPSERIPQALWDQAETLTERPQKANGDATPHLPDTHVHLEFYRSATRFSTARVRP